MKANEQLLIKYFSTIKPTLGFETRLVDACIASDSIAQLQRKSQQQFLIASAEYQSNINLLRKVVLRRSSITGLFSLAAFSLTSQLSKKIEFEIATQFGQLDVLPTGVWVVLPVVAFILLIQIVRSTR
jgi:hypothetical protein